MNNMSFYEEIATVAYDLYERSGRIEGRDLDNWLEAERIVRSLKKIAGENGKRYIKVNVPPSRHVEERRNQVKDV